jgi:TrmH family RNA methyltransferase
VVYGTLAGSKIGFSMPGKNRIKDLRLLHQKKHREEQKKFLAEGVKIIPELIASGFPVEEIFAVQRWIDSNQKLIRESNVSFIPVSLKEMEMISCLSAPQDVLAVCSIPEEPPADAGTGELVLLFDSIRDPGNAGTLIRLADWFGVSAVVASDDSVEWTNPKVIQATMGSFIRVRPTYVHAENWLASIHKQVEIFATVLEGQHLYTSEFPTSGVIILSNESRGLSKELMPFVSRKLTIPRFSTHPQQVESLNAAMAGAVVLGEFSRRRLTQSA